MSAKKRVAIVGSGNWGCAIAKIVGNNCQRHNHLEEEVCRSGFHQNDSK
jgi:glycerol-3-phosphate dehydrogenase